MRAFKATNPHASFAMFIDWYLPEGTGGCDEKRAEGRHLLEAEKEGEGEVERLDQVSEGDQKGVLVINTGDLTTPTKAGLGQGPVLEQGPGSGLRSSKDVHTSDRASSSDRASPRLTDRARTIELLDLLWHKCTPPCFAHEQRPLVSRNRTIELTIVT